MHQSTRYLFRHKNNRFYYRQVVPASLRPHINKTEIKKSLGTYDPKIAALRCSKFHLQTEMLFQSMRKKIMNNMLEFTIKKSHVTEEGVEETVEISIDPDNIDAELEALKKAKLYDDANGLLDLKVMANEKFAGCKLHDSNAKKTRKRTRKSKLLSRLIQQYADDKIADSSWSDGTARTNQQGLDILLFILGDRSYASIDRTAAKGVRESLKKYPVNKNKRKEFNGLSMQDIKQLNVEDTISVRSINKYLTIYSSLFKWARLEGLVEQNPFDGISVKDTEHASEKRYPFDQEDLSKIFGSRIYTHQEYDKNFKYWIPLIALYSGARRGEIAQLEVNDVLTVGDIPVFDFNISSTSDKHQKKIKNGQSIRQVPIHPKLLELGILDFVNKQKSSGEARLFPELTWNDKDGYGRMVSDWFIPKYLPSVGVDTSKKKFHSFRSTLANALEDAGAPDEIIQQLAGHKTSQSVLRKHYLQPNKAKLLLDWISKVDFGDIY